MKKESLNKKTLAMLMSMIITGSIMGVADAKESSQENLNNYTLEQMVVTASRYDQSEFNANANLTVINKEKLEQQHYQNVEEALKQVPGVDVTNYGPEGFVHSNAFRINGSENVVLLIDGVRYSQAYDGFKPSLLNNMDDIEKIEVLKGSATTLYGADAKGGVINIITRKPQGKKSTINYSAGNFGTIRYGLSTEGRENNFYYKAGYQKLRSGDYKDGKGNKVESNGNTNSYSGRFGYEYGEGSDVNINYNKSKQAYKYYNDFYGDGHVKGDSDTEDFGMQWKHKFNNNISNVFSAKRITTDFTNFTEVGGQWVMNIKTTAINDQFTYNQNKNVLVAGFDYNKDAVDYFNGTSWGSTKLTDGVTQKGAYLQDTFNFTDNVDLTGGIRYVDHSIGGDKWVPKAELGLQLSPETRAYISYNEFFVAPSYYQYFGPYGGSQLKAETGKTLQIGLKHKFDDTADVALSVYRTNSNNRVVWDNASYKYANTGESKIKGWNLKVNKAFDDSLSGYVSYTHLNVEDITNGKVDKMNKGYLPKGALNLGLTYAKEKWDVGIEGKFVMDRGVDQPDYKFPAKDYLLCNLGANYKPTKNVKIMAQVNNIFDKFYAEHSAASATNPDQWYTMPGRSYILGVEYSF